jgi:hypothetical protein
MGRRGMECAQGGEGRQGGLGPGHAGKLSPN